MITFLKQILEKIPYNVKRNLVSFILGVAIGLPISIYAVNHRTPHEAWYIANRPETEIYPVDVTIIVEEVNEATEEVMEDIVETKAMRTLTDEELEVLARCVEAEAGNQDLYGRQLVVDVIFNRVDSDQFPDDIINVIYEENQFSVVSDGRIDEVTPSEDTYKAIALECDLQTNTEVLFFCSKGFHPYGTPWKKVGDHYFCINDGTF